MDPIVAIDGELDLLNIIDGQMDLASRIDGELGNLLLIDRDPAEHYEGPYIVTPLVLDPITLETKDKMMDDDVTILKVPYLETANPSGGNTIFIGENANA